MADFQFFLNRQGPRGPKGFTGDKGDDGKTPVPRTGTNTAIETTVIFDTGDGNPYETPNLKYPIEDRGGNMVMLDRDNSTQYYGTPDQATDNSYGVVKLATPDSILDDPLDSDVVTYELFDDNNQAIKTVTDGLSGRIDSLITSKADKSDVYTKTQTDSLLNNKSNVGHTHNYNEITNKPDIGNGTITITQGGVVKGSFTTNQLGNQTITLESGGGGGGTTYTAGNGIDISSDTISVKVDGSTVGFDSSGNLTAATYTLPTATTSTLGGVKIDGTSITIDNDGIISAVGSAPSNMVTTNTQQTITSTKTFTDGIKFSEGNTYYFTQRRSSSPITINGGGYNDVVRLTSYGIIIVDSYGRSARIDSDYGLSSLLSNQGLLIKTAQVDGIVKNYLQLYGTTLDNKIYRYNNDSISSPSTLTNFLLESNMLDGTTIQYNSTSGKVEVVGGGGGGSQILKKTITQASSNVSESSGTVTVTDADVTTSTLVTLYPGDTTTETWLANNLSSNIITEGTGNFTFSIVDTLPSTFSMYYTIQEVV